MSARGKLGWFAASAASFAVAVLLSQIRFKEEREFPSKFSELASEEHGHETAADAADTFFGARETANRLQWLFFALGVLVMARGIFRRDLS